MLRQEFVARGFMYAPDAIFDEMRAGDGSVRPAYRDYLNWYEDQESRFLMGKHRDAEIAFRRTGITFNVYGEDEAEELSLIHISEPTRPY